MLARTGMTTLTATMATTTATAREILARQWLRAGKRE